MNALNLRSIILLISMFDFLLQATQTMANNLDDFAYDELEKSDENYNENSNEILTPINYRPERELKLSQGENKKIGNILNNIRKNLYDYIIERGLSSNKEDIKVALNDMAQKERKEKKPSIRIPFKWGR